MFCHAVLFLYISSHYLPGISSEDSFESCDIEEAAGSQRKSKRTLLFSHLWLLTSPLVHWSMCSSFHCLQGIRTYFWFRSSPHRKSNRTQEPPEFYSFIMFSVKLLEILFNSNSQCTNKSSAMWNQSSWFICSHCACKTENKVARRHFPQCKIHL